MAQSIELDCPPGSIRPDDLIGGVLVDTGFKVKDFDTGAPFFGNQTWVLKDPKREPEYLVVKPVIKERVTALYNQGLIRYGSW